MFAMQSQRLANAVTSTCLASLVSEERANLVVPSTAGPNRVTTMVVLPVATIQTRMGKLPSAHARQWRCVLSRPMGRACLARMLEARALSRAMPPLSWPV